METHVEPHRISGGGRSCYRETGQDPVFFIGFAHIFQSLDGKGSPVHMDFKGACIRKNARYGAFRFHRLPSHKRLFHFESVSCELEAVFERNRIVTNGQAARSFRKFRNCIGLFKPDKSRFIAGFFKSAGESRSC